MTGRFLAVIAAIYLSAVICTVYAVPAYSDWRTMTQPDGTSVELCQIGDEFFHYWINRDGQTVARNEVGYWEVTDVAEELQVAKQRRAAVNAARRSYAQNMRKVCAGKTNMTKGLVILVNYQDVQFQSDNDKAAFTAMMMDDSYNYNPTYPGSAHTYFTDQSNGQYSPQFDVYGPYTLSKNCEYYGANDAKGNDVRPANMIKEACELADADGVDFSQYDLDADGNVDFVYVFYAGNGEADSHIENTVWPHSWTLTYAGLSLYCDNKKINLYACSSELNSSNNRSGIATFCHEFSHVIGMPDYYDVDYGYNYKNGLTPMQWTLMDGGTYNGKGYCPPNYSAFDKYYMGWVTPAILNSAKNVTLTTGYTDAYQINANGSLAAYSSTDTQYYIENRQKSGWDKALPGHGMLVWKVAYNQTAWDNNAPNATTSTIRYGVLCADGAHTSYVYEGSTYWKADNGDTYPGTTNVININASLPFTTYPITDICESDSTITFKFMGGVATTYEYEVDAENCTITPSLGTITEDSTLTLTCTPDSNYLLSSSCFAITMGSRDLMDSTDFTYSDGILSIPHVTNDVYVLAIAQQKPVAVTGVSLDQDSAKVVMGQSFTLTATVSPSEATNQDVAWSTDNGAVATVVDGVVTGVAEGETTITVTTVDGGWTATCVVTVSPKPIATNVEQTIDAPRPTMFMEDGHFIIEYNDVRYSITGEVTR